MSNTNESVSMSYANVPGDFYIRLPWAPDADPIKPSDLIPEAVAYLLQYGAGKTGQDAASGKLKDATELHVAIKAGKGTDTNRKQFAEWCKLLGMSRSGCLAMTPDSFGKAVASALSDARWAKVIAGQMPIPNTAMRLSGVDRIIWDMAEDLIKSRAKARGYATLDAERLRMLTENMVALEDDEDMILIRAEANRQIEVREKLKGVSPTTGATADDDVMSLLRR